MAKRKKSRRTKSQAEIRAEHEEKRREAHARMIFRRQGDPRYVQQSLTPTGRKLSWSPDSKVGRELEEALEANRRSFVEKFGREPGPGDPLIFDPDADTPTALTPERQDQVFAEMSQAAMKAGIDPALVDAWQELGFLVTEENQHLLSAHEIAEWEDAVRRARGEDDDWYEDEEESDEDLGLDSLLVHAAADLQVVVQQTLSNRDAEPALRLADAFKTALAEDSEEGGHALTIIFTTLMGWLAGAREAGVNGVVAVGWVETHLGAKASESVNVLAGLVGHPAAPNLTVNEVDERLGPRFIPAMIWLAAGVAATAGKGDAQWLRQFDMR